jgi:hypothetical protein
MDLKETAGLLGWKRELVESAIEQGVETPSKKSLIKLAATRQGSDYDIREEDVDVLLAAFEKEDPGRNPPVAVRRELLVESGYQCSICKSDSPLQFHHIVDWAKLKHHDPKHMLAVCGSCHNKIGLGQIDTKAQKQFKVRLTRPIQEQSANLVSTGNVKPSATDQIVNQSATERIVWCLPRGFLMLEDVACDDNPSWCVVVHYYHFGDGWRMGTHFHKSYARHWRYSTDLEVQCRKVGLPLGDRSYAYGAFYLMQELRDTDKHIDVRQKVEAHAKGGDFVIYYEPSKPIFLSEIDNKYPQLKDTGELRDLLEEMEKFIDADYSQAVISTSEEGFSIGHRVIVEATKFFGASHPSMNFIKTVVADYDRKWTTAKIKEWMKQLQRVLSDALGSR